jgi:hypothetical protein
MAEQIAVMEAVPLAERPHRLSELGRDDREHDDGPPSSRAGGSELDVVDARDPRVPHDLELLVRKLPLDGLGEASGRLPRGVGEDVDLERSVHGPASGP